MLRLPRTGTPSKKTNLQIRLLSVKLNMQWRKRKLNNKNFKDAKELTRRLLGGMNLE
jgi:hypothetical protein